MTALPDTHINRGAALDSRLEQEKKNFRTLRLQSCDLSPDHCRIYGTCSETSRPLEARANDARNDSLISSKIRPNQARTLLASAVWAGNDRRHCMYKLPLTSGEPLWEEGCIAHGPRNLQSQTSGVRATLQRHQDTTEHLEGRETPKRRRGTPRWKVCLTETQIRWAEDEGQRKTVKPRLTHLGRAPEEMLMGMSTYVTRVGYQCHGPSD